MSLETLGIPEIFDAAQVEDWLVQAVGSIAGIEELVAGLATVIDGAGLPIDRLSVGVPFLLPHILGMQVLWARGSPIERRHIPAGPDSSRQLEDSPVATMQCLRCVFPIRHSTRSPEGFADASLGVLMVNLAPVLEVRTLRYFARSLLNVYVGPTASGRVLDGAARRGCADRRCHLVLRSARLDRSGKHTRRCGVDRAVE